MSATSQDTIYIYQHVPKCGGQAFRLACQNYFHLLLEKPPKKTDPRAWQEFLNGKVDFSTIPDRTMICGHLIHDGIRPRERYAEEIARGNVRIITVLREPIERAISAYFFRQRQGKQTEPQVGRHLQKVKNPMAHQLGLKDQDPRAFLESYFFVGVTEYMQTSIDLLSRLVGEPTVEVPVNNVTKREPYELGPEIVEFFRRNNATDYALHESAVALLGERCQAELGRPLPKPVMRVVAAG
jgi:hypothetical protein